MKVVISQRLTSIPGAAFCQAPDKYAGRRVDLGLKFWRSADDFLTQSGKLLQMLSHSQGTGNWGNSRSCSTTFAGLILNATESRTGHVRSTPVSKCVPRLPSRTSAAPRVDICDLSFQVMAIDAAFPIRDDHARITSILVQFVR